tara:strand:+ start:1556 stop:2701 length:1146 start_codon:yes stop_codon:yes gene_type:complete
LVEDTIDKDDVSSLIEWLQTFPRLTKGPLTVQFENEWSEWLGCEKSVFVNSGSSANLLMAAALLESGKLKNKKVIVPAVSWVTTVAPFMQLGYEPILCDCDPNDLGLSISHLKELVKKHDPGSMILVHVLGYPANMREISAICKDNDIFLMEDCCEAHGATYGNKKVGTFSDMSSFSFYFGHHMSTIEGGMVCTNDEDLNDILLMLRSHGWVRDLDEKKQRSLVEENNVDEFNSLYFFVKPGYNLRSTDLNAFLGIRQLKKLDDSISKRRDNLKRFEERLSGHLKLQSCPEGKASPLAFGIIHDNKKQIVDSLVSNGVECRPLICGSMSKHPFWVEKYGTNLDVPNAENVHKNGIYVPCHQNMSTQDVDKICDLVIASLAK